MRRVKFFGLVLAATFCAGAAVGTATPQQACDNARIAAWSKYQACVDAVLAKDAKGVVFDQLKAFWKCRHTYLGNWAKFQAKKSLVGSTCIGSRFTDTDSGTTVTDGLTGLVWEKKTNDDTVHDKDNEYAWSTGAPYKADGTAFGTFLTGAVTGLNVAGFAGAKDWRLPTLAELQSLLLDFPCKGDGGSPTCACAGACVDSGFANLDPNTQPELWYYSSTSYFVNPVYVWGTSFWDGSVSYGDKTINLYTVYVRAVRGGF